MIPPTSAPRPGGRMRELRAMLALAWPLALTNLSQVALLLTDTLYLARLGEIPLAAATLGGNLYFITLSLPFGLAFAATAMLAHEKGRVRHHVREMRRTFRQAFWLGVMGFLPMALLLWHGGAVLLATGQEPALAAEAERFMRAILWGILPFYGFMLLRGFLSALQRPQMALWVSLAAIGLNALLGYAFIAGGFGAPQLGTLGAGLSSAVSNLFMCAALALLMARDRSIARYRLAGRFWRTDFRRMAEIVRVGLPITGTMVMEIGVFSGTALVMGWFGSTAVAAHAVALQVASATFMVPMGISQAATARVGLAAGARDRAGAQRAGWTAIGISVAFMAATAVLLLLLPGTIAALFLPPELQPTRELAALLLMVAGVFQLADGVQATAAGALRGLKDTRMPLLFAALGYWVLGLPTGLLLGFHFGLGPVGVWFGLAAGLGFMAVLMTLRWRRMSALPPELLAARALVA